MSNETTTAPAATQTRTININGRPLTFLQGVVKHGDHKGQPVLVPHFKVPNRPDMGEVMDFAVAFGQQPLAKQFAKTLRSLVTEACSDAVVQGKDANGATVYTLDDGKIVVALNESVAELDAGTADAIRTELEIANKAFNEFFAGLFANYIAKRLPVPDGEQNKVLQLTKKQAELQAKLEKRSKAKTAKAGAAATK